MHARDPDVVDEAHVDELHVDDVAGVPLDESRAALLPRRLGEPNPHVHSRIPVDRRRRRRRVDTERLVIRRIRVRRWRPSVLRRRHRSRPGIVTAPRHTHTRYVDPSRRVTSTCTARSVYASTTARS